MAEVVPFTSKLLTGVTLYLDPLDTSNDPREAMVFGRDEDSFPGLPAFTCPLDEALDWMRALSLGEEPEFPDSFRIRERSGFWVLEEIAGAGLSGCWDSGLPLHADSAHDPSPPNQARLFCVYAMHTVLAAGKLPPIRGNTAFSAAQERFIAYLEELCRRTTRQ